VGLNVVGISAHFHDAACCLLKDGHLVAAAQEERFSRLKHDPTLPRAAFRYCLEAGGLTIDDVDCIAYYEDPVKKLDRQLWMGLPHVPPATPQSLFRLDAVRPEREVRELLGFEGPIDYFDHHQSHAASSYYFSGFSDAAMLTVDAVGEWATASYGRAEGPRLELFEEVRFPDSLGLLYSAITSYLGFEVNDGEYKVMGLAPYGAPRYLDAMRSLLTVEDGGRFRLDMRYFDFLGGGRMFSPDLCALFGAPPRKPEAELSQFAKDIARSLQVLLEEVLLAKVEYLHGRVPSANLCMAGGVALNCVAVERIRKARVFANVFVQPAATDAGGVSPDDIAEFFRSSPAHVEDFRSRGPDLLQATAHRLAAGKVVGWFQGRMEFGPRALGNRSILADPRPAGMRGRINELVKKREAFRPFAPAVLASKAAAHFERRLPGRAPRLRGVPRLHGELTGIGRFAGDVADVADEIEVRITEIDIDARGVAQWRIDVPGEVDGDVPEIAGHQCMKAAISSACRHRGDDWSHDGRRPQRTAADDGRGVGASHGRRRVRHQGRRGDDGDDDRASAVNHVPVMTGGAGSPQVRQSYGRHFIPGHPPDGSWSSSSMTTRSPGRAVFLVTPAVR
jgi:carbamoyltransferase